LEARLKISKTLMGHPGAMLGIHHSEETRRKISESHKGEKSIWFGTHHSAEWRYLQSQRVAGSNNPFFGKHHSIETRMKISEMQRGKKHKPHSEETRFKIGIANSGENSGHWKGDTVGYGQLHEWVRTHKPRVEICEICGIAPVTVIANISGQYKRDINDYKWTCQSCNITKLKTPNHKFNGFFKQLIAQRKKRIKEKGG